MAWELHKKKNKELYNVYSTVIDGYVYRWSKKDIIATHVYSKYQQDARRKAREFMQEVDKEIW